MAELGRAYIDVHADMDPFQREVPAGAKSATDRIDKDFEKVGKQWGDTLSDGTSESLKRHGKDFVQAIESSTAGRIIHTKWGYKDRDTGRFVSALADDVENGIEEAFAKATRPGGPISTIGTGIADAVGAGFNVSGKSPLIAVLIPAFGALGAAILGAIQAANALVAVLTTIPALIAAIGLQVGVLMLAFDGMGTAIQNAFKATNAQELQEAIEGLTPAAQSFVRQLIPIRDFFNYLKVISQQNFFAAFGDTLTRVLAALHPVLSGGFAKLATSMGTLFRELGLFFASPVFVDFVRDIFPATAKWLASFGPAFVSLLKALIGMADAAIPFLTRIGMIFNNSIASFVDWLNGLVKSGSFTKWLDSMGSTLDTLAQLFFQVSEFFAVFLAQLNEAGGEDLIKSLTEAFSQLVFILASPLGKEAMIGLIDLAKLLTAAFVGLVDIILVLAAAWGVISSSIQEFFKFVIEVYAPAWWEFWTVTVPGALTAAWNAISKFFSDLWFRIRLGFDSFIQAGKEWAERMYVWVTGLPTRILNAIGDLGSLLWQRGRALIQGFIDGIVSKWNELRSIAANIAHTIGDFLPGSPAKEGPLSGQGYTMFRGQRMVQDLIKGIDSQEQNLRNASLNAATQIVNIGGVRMEFGSVPTEQEARTAGEAVGAGITSQMTDRDVALLVRTM